MTETRILGLLISDRIKEAGRTQLILSKYSKLIRSRLGFHELNENVCSRSGIIVLHLTGNPEEWKIFEDELGEIGGLEVQNMSFTY
jgi:lactate dehydrogenase-like 2-hydroxyacid dehydrogenase